MIAVVDYGIGNVRSIVSAFEHVGADVELTRELSSLKQSSGLVLPGVGAFSHGVGKLKEFNLFEVIKEIAEAGTPILGICLGMQLLFSESYEFGTTKGLGIIPGSVKKLELSDDKCWKLPHISWNSLRMKRGESWNNSILDGVSTNNDLYFVHSFAGIPENPDHVLSTTMYSGNEFCSTVKKGNIYGCQFHPEKSACTGLNIILNFVKICSKGQDRG